MMESRVGEGKTILERIPLKKVGHSNLKNIIRKDKNSNINNQNSKNGAR